MNKSSYPVGIQYLYHFISGLSTTPEGRNLQHKYNSKGVAYQQVDPSPEIMPCHRAWSLSVFSIESTLFSCSVSKCILLGDIFFLFRLRLTFLPIDKLMNHILFVQHMATLVHYIDFTVTYDLVFCIQLNGQIIRCL